VFAPSLFLTISVESGSDGSDEIHLHGGGQGFWVAQLMHELGVDVTVVAPIGGEAGTVIRAIVDAAGLELRGVPMNGTTGAHLNDRRSGDLTDLATMHGTVLDRHDVDELYGAMVVEGLDADVCVLAGPGSDPVLGPEVYERLTTDLRANDRLVVTDLSGDALHCALGGGVSVLKTSADDLRDDGLLEANELDKVLWAAHRLATTGADVAVVTRAEEGAIAVRGDDAWIVRAPPLEPVEHRGSGDSLTAGIAAALAAGRPLEEALRMGAAAGALNVTRRGFGSGSRQEIERLTEQVAIEPVTVS
jgi:1-phosphofructokinase